MVTFSEHMSVITLPLNEFIDPYEVNKLYIKKYIFTNLLKCMTIQL